MNVEVAVVDDGGGGRRSGARCRTEESGDRRPGRHHLPDLTTCSRPRNPYPVVGPGRDHNMLWSPRLPPPRPTAASAGFSRGGRRKLQVISITFHWASSSRSACPDRSPRSPRSPASSPGPSPPTMSRASRPAAATAGTRRLSGTTSCTSRPTAAPPAGAHTADADHPTAPGRSRSRGRRPSPPSSNKTPHQMGTASCMTRSSGSGARSSIRPSTPHPTTSSGLMSPRTHWSAQRAKICSLKGRAL